MVVASDAVAKAVRALGGFYEVALNTYVPMFKPPFAFREFIARVSLMLTGAADFSGSRGYTLIGGADVVFLHRSGSGRLPQRPTNRFASAIGGAAAYRGAERR